MKPDPKLYASRPRDSVSETGLANELRALGETESFEFVWELLSLHPILALELAPRVLRDPLRFERILMRGFREADASEIQWWLRSCINRIGARRSLALLRHAAEEDPDVLDRCLYHSRHILLEADPSLEPAFNALVVEK